MGGKYKIRVVEGKDLKKSDYFSESDPYVKIFTDQQNSKTSVVKDSKDPVWNESFELTYCSEEILKFKVFDEDANQDLDDPIGHAKIACTGWDIGRKEEFLLKLENVETGTIKVIVERSG